MEASVSLYQGKLILQRILGAFPQARITPVVRQSMKAGSPLQSKGLMQRSKAFCSKKIHKRGDDQEIKRMPFRNAFLVGKNFLFEEAQLIGAPNPSSRLMKRLLPILKTL